MFKHFLVAVLFVCGWTEALEPAVHTYPKLGITQMTLSNGMRICMKPTTFEDDEVLIRLTAQGGYASLPPAQRAAGELAAQIAWESGLDGMSTDKLTALIYEHSIELYAKILPYHRILEGTTEVGGIKVFFDLVKRYSTQKQFTREGFDKVSNMAKEMVRSRDVARSSPVEEWSRIIHTQEVTALKPLTLQDINTMEFDSAKQFFEESFSNPADFVCVIIGNFNVEEIIPLVNEYLGTIPAKGTVVPFQKAPAFPDRTVSKRIPAPGEKESLARLSFPLTAIEEPQQLHMAQLMAQVLETRLRSVLNQRFGATQGLVGSLELPFYPDLSLSWLAIQYRCPSNRVEVVQKAILDEIHNVSTQGPSEAELTSSWNQLREKEELWSKDNQYWLSVLSDYFLRGWGWDELRKTVEEQKPPAGDQLKEAMQKLLRSDRFTFVYTMP